VKLQVDDPRLVPTKAGAPGSRRLLALTWDRCTLNSEDALLRKVSPSTVFLRE
jgi:hypothetical protein